MDLNYTLSDLTSFHVLCIPLEISKERFEYYYNILIHKLEVIPYELITFYKNSPRWILKDITENSFQTGSLRLKFHQDSRTSTSSHLQFFKRFSIILGITENPSNAIGVYESLTKIVSEIDRSILTKLFCFESNEQSIRVEKTNQDFIPFPSYPEPERLINNIEIVVVDIVSLLLDELGRYLKSISSFEYQITTSWETEVNKVSKRREGRKFKILGDVCLLLNCLDKAGNYLSEALSIQNKNYDYLWAGATSESLAAFFHLRGLVENVQDHLMNAYEFYSKARVTSLMIESRFRMARYKLMTDLTQETLESLNKMPELEGLTNIEKRQVYLHLADIYSQISYNRKAAFYKYLAAQDYLENKNFQQAHDLIRAIAPAYQVLEEMPKYPAPDKRQYFDRNLYNKRENIKPWTKAPDYRGWHDLQFHILEALISLSKSLSDDTSSAYYSCTLLQMLHRNLDEYSQIMIRDELERSSSKVAGNMIFPVFPHLKSIKLMKLKKEIDVVSEGNDLFLYNPWKEAEKEAKVYWIQHSIHRVIIEMQNPLWYDIGFDSLKPTASFSAGFAPLSETIRRRSIGSYEVVIIPQEHGILNITGVDLQVHGLHSVQKIDPPCTVEVLSGVPELKFEFSEKNLIMLSTEYKTLNLNILNISRVNVTNFEIESNFPDFVTFNSDDLEIIRKLDGEAKHVLRIYITSTFKTETIEFKAKYAGINTQVKVAEKFTQKLVVNPSLEIMHVEISPVFNYGWVRELKRRNPTLSFLVNEFSDERLELNDNRHCVIKLILCNRSSETINITATLKNKTRDEIQRATLDSSDSHELCLLLERLPKPSQISLNERLEILWESRNDRHGKLNSLSFPDNQIIFAYPSPVKFEYYSVPGEYFSTLTIIVKLDEPLKNFILFIYPLREERKSAQLKPEDLIVTGNLSAVIPPDTLEFSHTISYAPLSDKNFSILAALGTKGYIKYWAHDVFRVNR